ncbi:MAG: MarC family protein [Caulobacteraceae bacterium]|nr:MarC family protein [Caulobacter sp.]
MGEAAFAVNFFVALFALIDPVGIAPLFAAATTGAAPSARWRIALYVSLFAFAFLLLFFFSGLTLLRFFGISLAAFRIAGGILLLLLGLDMARKDFSPAVAVDIVTGETEDPRTYARREFEKMIVPFGMPLLIGPGAISAVVLFSSEAQTKYGWPGMGAGVAAIAAISLVCLLVFMASGAISRVLGKVGSMIVVRVLGLILTALAIQFIITGVSDTTAGIIRRSVANPYPATARPHGQPLFPFNLRPAQPATPTLRHP